jgi:hypothetical protein
LAACSAALSGGPAARAPAGIPQTPLTHLLSGQHVQPLAHLGEGALAQLPAADEVVAHAFVVLEVTEPLAGHAAHPGRQETSLAGRRRPGRVLRAAAAPGRRGFTQEPVPRRRRHRDRPQPAPLPLGSRARSSSSSSSSGVPAAPAPPAAALDPAPPGPGLRAQRPGPPRSRPLPRHRARRADNSGRPGDRETGDPPPRSSSSEGRPTPFRTPGSRPWSRPEG